MTPRFSLTVQGIDIRSAVLSADGVYRYSLTRQWAPGPLSGYVLFVMLNPSTADAEKDDPTIRRCIAFAKTWGAHGLEVVNLFAFRATNPDELLDQARAVGPENGVALNQAIARAGKVIAAWGGHPVARGRASAVEQLITQTHDLHALVVNGDGSPKHPLYVRGNTMPKVYLQRRSAR